MATESIVNQHRVIEVQDGAYCIECKLTRDDDVAFGYFACHRYEDAVIPRQHTVIDLFPNEVPAKETYGASPEFEALKNLEKLHDQTVLKAIMAEAPNTATKFIATPAYCGHVGTWEYCPALYQIAQCTTCGAMAKIEKEEKDRYCSLKFADGGIALVTINEWVPPYRKGGVSSISSVTSHSFKVGDEVRLEGFKYDANKLRFDLIPSGVMERLAEVFTYGANKYSDRQWEGGMKYGRLYAAVQRHLHAFWRGEVCDSESGLPHLAHAAWGCLALLHYEEENTGTDDRAFYGDNQGDTNI